MLIMATCCAQAALNPGKQGADSTCSAFRPVYEPENAALASAAVGNRPFVLRGWNTNCSLDHMANSAEGLLRLLGRDTDVQILSQPLNDQMLLREALQRQDRGEQLYFQAAVSLQSSIVRRTLCMELPHRLCNYAFLQCLTPPVQVKLTQAAYAWTQLFVGSGGSGMEMHNDRLHVDVWGVQREGSKRFIFCPPHTEETLIASQGDGRLLDAFNASDWPPQFDAYECAYAKTNPGDLIYWPSKWFHQTSQLVRSVGLSSFSLTAQNFPLFIKSAEEHFENDPELLQKMKKCAPLLPQ